MKLEEVKESYHWGIENNVFNLDNSDIEWLIEEAEKIENVNGKFIAELIYKWADKNRMHPDDFDMLFAHELLEKLEDDK